MHLRSRPAGPLDDSRTKRVRTRGADEDAALSEYEDDDTEPFFFEKKTNSAPTAIICDLDGTLASVGHRRYLVDDTCKACMPKADFYAETSPDPDCSTCLGTGKDPELTSRKQRNWEEFHSRLSEDSPVPEVVDMLHSADADGHRIVFSTGRPDIYRYQTQWWLAENLPWLEDYDLLMRKSMPHRGCQGTGCNRCERGFVADQRPDDVVKEEMYREDIAPNYQVLTAIDDRPSVIAKWRELGIPVIERKDPNLEPLVKTATNKRTGAWPDVRNKARRIRRSGGVEIIRLDDDVIVAKVKGDHQTYEVEIFRQYPSAKAVTFWSCSCFPPGTPIAMADGTTKPIEEVREGDLVLTHSGRSRKVLKTMQREFNGNLVELTINGLPTSIQSTPEHPYLTANEDWGLSHLKPSGQYYRGVRSQLQPDYEVWKTADELVVGEYVVTTPPLEEAHVILEVQPNAFMGRKGHVSKAPQGKFYGRVRHEGRRYSTPQFDDEQSARTATDALWNDLKAISIKIDEALAEVLGWYIAEGFTTKDSTGVGFALGPFEEHVAQRLNTLLQQSLGVKGTIRRSATGVDYRVHSFALRKLVEHLVGKGVRTKALHADLLTLPTYLQQIMMDAWCAGDGHIRDGRATIATASENLARQGNLILSRLGYSSAIRKSNNPPGPQARKQGATHSTMLWNLAWGIDRSKNRTDRINDNGRTWRRIEEINHVSYSGTVYNFEVEDDNTYLVDWNTTVHNCKWGEWAFKRQVTYVGRFCSHALATLYEAHSQEYRKKPVTAAMSRKFYDSLLENENTRYLYHSVGEDENGDLNQEIIDSIMTKGLVPQGGYSDNWGSDNEPREGYVYLGDEHTVHTRYGLPLLRIDVSKLDHRNFVADEDLFANIYFEEDGYGPEYVDSDTLGDWAESNHMGHDPYSTQKSLAKEGTIAYYGTIPPNAISINPRISLENKDYTPKKVKYILDKDAPKQPSMKCKNKNCDDGYDEKTEEDCEFCELGVSDNYRCVGCEPELKPVTASSDSTCLQECDNCSGQGATMQYVRPDWYDEEVEEPSDAYTEDADREIVSRKGFKVIRKLPSVTAAAKKRVSDEHMSLLNQIRDKHLRCSTCNPDGPINPSDYQPFDEHLTKCLDISDDINRQLEHKKESGFYIGPEVRDSLKDFTLKAMKQNTLLGNPESAAEEYNLTFDDIFSNLDYLTFTKRFLRGDVPAPTKGGWDAGRDEPPCGRCNKRGYGCAYCHDDGLEDEYEFNDDDDFYCDKCSDRAHARWNKDRIVSYNIDYAHSWNRLEDGTILDASADQFGGGETVRIIPPNDRRQGWYQAYDYDRLEDLEVDEVFGGNPWRDHTEEDFEGIAGHRCVTTPKTVKKSTRDDNWIPGYTYQRGDNYKDWGKAQDWDSYPYYKPQPFVYKKEYDFDPLVDERIKRTLDKLSDEYPITKSWFKGHDYGDIDLQQGGAFGCILGDGSIYLNKNEVFNPNSSLHSTPKYKMDKPWSIGHGIEQLTAHEFAHVLHMAITKDALGELPEWGLDEMLNDTYLPIVRPYVNHEANPVRQITDEAKENNPKAFVSTYAQRDELENFAEAMLDHWTSLEPEPYSREIGTKIDALYHRDSGKKAAMTRKVVINGRRGPIFLDVEVADTPSAIQTGLMWRSFLPMNQGMLFDFKRPTTTGFWMQNVSIPLSIAFIDNFNRIIDIKDMDLCFAGTCPSYAPDKPFTMAIEVNQGWFKYNGINVGDFVNIT